MATRSGLVKFLSRKWETLKRGWHRFSRSRLSIAGLVMVLLVVFIAIFAPFISPYPKHAGKFVNFREQHQPPSWRHFFGTDMVGRDVLSRVFFGFRFSLMMGAIVMALVVPPGVFLGLLAGYFKDTWIDVVIMRLTDIFLSVPPLILALAIASVLTANLFNSMMAISMMWWPWYSRLTYGLASSLRNEYFVQAAEAAGAGRLHILVREILPNCVSPIFTKITLDMGWVILIGSALSFVGLGVQPPKPGLGTMVARGFVYMPDRWWISMFPAFAIMFLVLGFNLLGDGIRDVFVTEEF